MLKNRFGIPEGFLPMRFDGAKARTFDALLNAIDAALKTVAAQDAQGWFQSCGYATSHS